ncbi:hypothetical protein K438DRAFT_1956979 [Mycena galopus ATCC 62051]|nr:hypothetical protein K438DRAFT_1956979 [Mycena galopus ATCC 62051]
MPARRTRLVYQRARWVLILSLSDRSTGALAGYSLLVFQTVRDRRDRFTIGRRDRPRCGAGFPSRRSGCPTSGNLDVALAAVQHWPGQHPVFLVLRVRNCLNVEHEAGPRLSLGPKTTRPELRRRVRRRRERLSDPLRFPPGGCKHFGPSAFGEGAVWQPYLPAVAPSDRQAISRPAHCELQELLAPKRPASADAFRGVGSQPSCTLVVGPPA